MHSENEVVQEVVQEHLPPMQNNRLDHHHFSRYVSYSPSDVMM